MAEAVAAGDAEARPTSSATCSSRRCSWPSSSRSRRRRPWRRSPRGQAHKLIARHPHVYGEAVAETAGGVLDLWERQQARGARRPGIFHDLPAGLPALAYATKAQRRAASVGFDFAASQDALRKLDEEVAELRAEPGDRELGRRAVRLCRGGPGVGRRSGAGAAAARPALPRPGRARRPTSPPTRASASRTSTPTRRWRGTDGRRATAAVGTRSVSHMTSFRGTW